MPETSIIILNYNGAEFIEKCLDSVLRQTYRDFEIIVVDNNSTDRSIAVLSRYAQKIRMICNSENLGFAEGNNTGIKRAKGKYIFILNNDTVLDRHCIYYLMKAVKKNNVDMVSPKVLLENGDIDTLGLKLMFSLTGKDIKSLDQSIFQYKKVFCPSGVASFFTRKMLEDIKMPVNIGLYAHKGVGKSIGSYDYYDSSYFIYSEDFDLGFRAVLKGYKCVYEPKAVLWHIHGAVTKKFPERSIYLNDRNRLITLVKCCPAWLLFKYSFFILFYQFASILKYLAKGRFVTIKSKAEFIKNTKRYLNKRRIIQSEKVIDNRELERYCGGIL